MAAFNSISQELVDPQAEMIVRRWTDPRTKARKFSVVVMLPDGINAHIIEAPRRGVCFADDKHVALMFIDVLRERPRGVSASSTRLG